VPEVRITIVDRGWCGTCPISGDAAPWTPLVERLTRDLKIVERETGRLRVAREPLPAVKAEPPPATPGALGGHQLSRRGLFAALSKPKTLRPLPGVQLRQADVVPGRVDTASLEQRVAWLRGMSGTTDLPADLFPAATIAETCCSSQVCISACPTGALQVIDDTGRTGVAFDAPYCIQCGACESACPTQSISIAPEGIGAYRGPVALREVRRFSCTRCDADFAPATDDESICLACRKDSEVARLGHDLFRPRPMNRDHEPVV
jgi:NAD-dependent dihydropyrimidine dehydrogenase PreA subunit